MLGTYLEAKASSNSMVTTLDHNACKHERHPEKKNL